MKSHVMVALVLIGASLVTARASAQPRDLSWCGTGRGAEDRARVLHQTRRMSAKTATAESSVDLRDGTFLVRADGGNLAGDHPFDLDDTSLVFRRSNDGYTASRATSRFAVDRGPLLHIFNSDSAEGWHFRPYTLQAFAFPFGGTEHRNLYISAFNGITFSPPSLVEAEQFDELEIAGFGPAIISPLLLTNRSFHDLPYPNVFLRQTAERLVITWITPPGSRFGYEIQAALYRNGDIIFSYRDVRGIRWGSPIVSAGRDAWRSPVVAGEANDDANDASPSYSETLRTSLDIRTMSVSRLNESAVLEARVTFAQPIALEALSANQSLVFIVSLNDPMSADYIYAGIVLRRDGSSSVYHRGRFVENSGAVRMDRDSITFLLLQEDFSAESADFFALSGTSDGAQAADFGTMRVSLGTPARRFAHDFSTAAEVSIRQLAFEPFTAPALDLFAVWNQLKGRYGLTDASIDALAVYQTFFTDIVFYAGAYAVGGNPQADGVTNRRGYGTDEVRAPTLMHMNVLDYGWNEEPENSGHVLLHEFGHRWLYGIRIDENGQTRRSLNPVSEHPAEYVHTPAAFPVFSSADASVMGGGVFRDNGNGTFTTGLPANFGYSWTDLYLMGLAAPHEVPSWFYVDNTDPPLGPQYYPPGRITVSGTRRDVTVNQVISAMGPRSPGDAGSQKNFRVLFVLMVRGDETNMTQQLDLIRQHRTILEETFEKATGSRGSVSSSPEFPSRSRRVRR